MSAGSIAMSSIFGETYFDPPKCSGEWLSSEDIVFAGPEGDITMTLVMAEGVGLVDLPLFRTWNTTISKTWRTQKQGPVGYRCRRTQSTMTRPSRSSTARLRSSPKDTGNCSTLDTTKGRLAEARHVCAS